MSNIRPSLESIADAVTGVQRRQQRRFAMRCAAIGLIVSGLAVAGLGVWRLIMQQPLEPIVWLGLLAVGPVVGMLFGLMWKRPVSQAATAIDEHYRLKDRAVTALEFAPTAESSPFHELQVHEAAGHMRDVEANKVVPWQWPGELAFAAAASIVAVALLLWPLSQNQLQARIVEPLPGVLMAADEIAMNLDDLEALAEEEDSQELRDLVDEIRQQVDALKEPGVELKEALASISEMQERLNQEQAQYNESLMDAQLKSVGGAMMAASDFQGAANELEKGNFDKAAKEFEQLDQVKFERKEQNAVTEKLAKLSGDLEQLGLGQLSDTVSEIAESVEGGSSDGVVNKCRRLATTIRTHKKRKKINQMLKMQTRKMSQCKSMCKKDSFKTGFKRQKSTKPSQQFGMGTSGNIDGERTDLTSMRNLEEITGEAGAGPSEVEITYSPEGKETARRSYKDAYRDYKKMSEAVLDSEPIPLGHRQTIRRYFELIRPSAEDAVKIDAETESTE